MHLPKDPLGRFVEIYDALNSDRGWFQDVTSLRFAAITAVSCPGEASAVAAAIRAVAEDINSLSGWFGELKSSLRFIVAALLVLHEDTARDFLDEVERVRALMRQRRLRRGGIYETMAILILRINADRQPIDDASIERFQAIYEEMKRYHWWITSADDFPACAILVNQPESHEAIGYTIEEIYQQLHEVGFKKGNPLQTAANLLYLVRVKPRDIAVRYHDLAMAFREARTRVWRSEYDELAILSFLKQPPSQVVPRVLDFQQQIRGLKPDPGRSLSFNLASGIAFLELVQLDEDLKEITDAKVLMDMQAIISAQQAAAIAAASSAAAAASAASAGSS